MEMSVPVNALANEVRKTIYNKKKYYFRLTLDSDVLIYVIRNEEVNQ